MLLIAVASSFGHCAAGLTAWLAQCSGAIPASELDEDEDEDAEEQEEGSSSVVAGAQAGSGAGRSSSAGQQLLDDTAGGGDADGELEGDQLSTADGKGGGEGDDGGGGWAEEQYEEDEVRGVVPAYLKFSNRLTREPSQCVR